MDDIIRRLKEVKMGIFEQHNYVNPIFQKELNLLDECIKELEEYEKEIDDYFNQNWN